MKGNLASLRDWVVGGVATPCLRMGLYSGAAPRRGDGEELVFVEGVVVEESASTGGGVEGGFFGGFGRMPALLK
jgi:hypothetical protein